MYHRSLPKLIGAGDNKGQLNLQEITSAKSVDSEGKAIRYGRHHYISQGGKSKGEKVIGIPGERWQYPQFGPEPNKNEKGEDIDVSEEQAWEGIKEFVADSGGAVAALANINDSTQKAAVSAAKASLRSKENVDDSSMDSAIEAALKQSREFSWAAAVRVTNKTAADGARQVLADFEAGKFESTADLAAALASVLGGKK